MYCGDVLSRYGYADPASLEVVGERTRVSGPNLFRRLVEAFSDGSKHCSLESHDHDRHQRVEGDGKRPIRK